jgi:hypothetical protein
MSDGERRIDKPNDHIEFRYYGDELDEIVATNVSLHFECMGTGSWWMNLTTPDGRDFAVNLGVTNRKLSEAAEERWRGKYLSNWAHHEED